MAKSSYQGDSAKSPDINLRIFKKNEDEKAAYYYHSHAAQILRLAQLEKSSQEGIAKKTHEDRLIHLREEFNERRDAEKTLVEEGKKSQEDAEIEIQKLRKKYLSDRKREELEYNNLRLQNEDIYQKERKANELQSIEDASNYYKKLYDQQDARTKALWKSEEVASLKKHKATQEAQAKELEALLDMAKTDAERVELADKLNGIYEDIEDLNAALEEPIKELNNLQDIILKSQLSYLGDKEKELALQAALAEETKKQAQIREDLANEAATAQLEGRSENTEKISDLNQQLEESYKRVSQIQDLASQHTKSEVESKRDQQLKSAKDKVKELKTDNEVKKQVLSGSARKARKAAKKGEEVSVADNIRETNRQARAAQRESEELDRKEKGRQANEDFFPLLKENIKKQISLAGAMTAGFKALQDLAKNIDENISTFYSYQGTINARLQGTDTQYKELLDTVKKNVGFSGLVSQKKIIENIKTLVDSGTAYNLELRAFLAATSENIAKTFDAFDANLLRIIRIQQQDSTAARLGMEASLNKLFNEYFSDSSYLNDAFDTVSQSILDASAQLSRDQSTEFEYIVQKWLGALYSVGLSQDAVSTIAQGINYLATGNVEALNNNDSMRTLLAMTSAKANEDFGQLLLEGLDPTTTNKLLKSMVEYLAEIATDDSNNKVTQSVYTSLFGMSSITDLQVFSSLSENIESIYSNTQTYKESVDELNNQLNQISSRLHLSQIIDNAFENISASSSLNIGNNAGVYGLWKTLNVIEGLTGGIPIPDFYVMGNSVALNTTLEGMLKAGIGGVSFMTSLLGGLFSGNLFGTMDLNQWGYDAEEVITRGKGTSALKKGMDSGVSESATLNSTGSASTEDMKSTSLTDASKSAEEDSKIVNSPVEDNVDIYQQIRDGVYKDEATTTLGELIKINERLDKPFKTQIDELAGLNHQVWYVQILGEGDPIPSGGSSDTSNSEITSTIPSKDTSTGTTGYLSGNDTTTQNEAGSSVDKVIEDLELQSGNLISIDFSPLEQILNSVAYKSQVTNWNELITLLNENTATNEKLYSSLVDNNNNNYNDVKTQIGNQLTDLDNTLTNEIKDSTTEIVHSQVTENQNNSSEISNNEVTNAISPLETLLSLLSLDRVFKVSEFSDGVSTNTNNSVSNAISNLENQNSSIIESLDEFNTSQITGNINQLESQISDIQTVIGKESHSQSSAVSLNGLSDEMKTYFSNTIKNIILEAMAHKSGLEGEEEDMTFTESLQKAFSLMNLNVTITNDFFNEYLQKNAFAN